MTYPKNQKELYDALYENYENLWSIISEWYWEHQSAAFFCGERYWAQDVPFDCCDYRYDTLKEKYGSPDVEGWAEDYAYDHSDDDDDKWEELYQEYIDKLRFGEVEERVMKDLFSHDFDPKNLVDFNVKEFVQQFHHGCDTDIPTDASSWVIWLNSLESIDDSTLLTVFDAILYDVNFILFDDEGLLPYANRLLSSDNIIFDQHDISRYQLLTLQLVHENYDLFTTLEFSIKGDIDRDTDEVFEALHKDAELLERVTIEAPAYHNELLKLNSKVAQAA